jgi:hypothetical protein
MRRESLRLVELVALTPRCLPVVWSFLIHLPGALRSTGITRLHRSYGSSDSCQAAVWRLAGLIASWTEPSDRSVSKHPPSSRSLGLHSTNGRAAESGFLEADPPTEQGNAGVLWLRHWTVGSPRRKTESSSSPTDRSFTSWCSPPPLTRTQFRSVTTARPAADRDSHPADSIHSQSHRPRPYGRSACTDGHSLPVQAQRRKAWGEARKAHRLKTCATEKSSDGLPVPREPALLAKRSHDGEARPASREWRAGWPERTSGDGVRSAPSRGQLVRGKCQL